ncbi:Hypothetical_protein [Hexamita inflata]|uniref:Hypothetical_protein n=1 Tax=Hexamita inflata TaxID=28002 RepID=A0ABP1KY73_9EUKA
MSKQSINKQKTKISMLLQIILLAMKKQELVLRIYNMDLINGVRRNKQYNLELSSRLTIKVNSIKHLLSKIKEGNYFEVEKQRGRKPFVTTEHLKTVGQFVVNQNGSIKRSQFTF